MSSSNLTNQFQFDLMKLESKVSGSGSKSSSRSRSRSASASGCRCGCGFGVSCCRLDTKCDLHRANILRSRCHRLRFKQKPSDSSVESNRDELRFIPKYNSKCCIGRGKTKCLNRGKRIIQLSTRTRCKLEFTYQFLLALLVVSIVIRSIEHLDQIQAARTITIKIGK